MLDVWIYSILSVIVVSLISLVGIFTISLKEERLSKILLYLVSFAAGGLLGGASIHMLPEAVGEFGLGIGISMYFLAGIIVFFILEKMIHWRHCHIPTSRNHPHPFAYMNLVGDGVHNFIDGLIIGGAYLIGIPLGIATTLAVIFHEIPQEIGDFGVLLHGGFKKKKAILMNLLTALTAVVGTVVALVTGIFIENIGMFLLPFAAGGFFYIALSDLVPELHKDSVPFKKSLTQLIFMLLGILVMLLLVFLK